MRYLYEAFLSGLFIFFILTVAIIPDWKSIMINLGTEAIFVIIVFVGVERIIEKTNSERWAESDRIIKIKINRIISMYTSSLKVNFKYGDEIFDYNVLKTLDPYKINEVGIRVLRTIILPEIDEKFNAAENSEIISILDDIKKIHSEIDYIFSLFSPRLKPEIIEYLLKIQETIEPTLQLASNDHPIFDAILHDKGKLIRMNLKNIGNYFLELNALLNN